MKQVVLLLLIFVIVGCCENTSPENDSDSRYVDTASEQSTDTNSDSAKDTEYPENCAGRDSEQCELDTHCKNLMGYYIMEHEGMVYSCRESYQQIECVNYSQCDTDEIVIRSETRACWVATNYCEGETEGWTTESLEENCPRFVESAINCR